MVAPAVRLASRACQSPIWKTSCSSGKVAHCARQGCKGGSGAGQVRRPGRNISPQLCFCRASQATTLLTQYAIRRSVTPAPRLPEPCPRCILNTSCSSQGAAKPHKPASRSAGTEHVLGVRAARAALTM